ncbi:glycosyl hydrolase superfamily protein [Actinidia rufa]|uniref:Chitinase domain-containing protein 1 n=1 Tax=Actinidia rufa TaxID=165716 RepID=A0A7J0F0U5_9ERIC|nr:glycosyl hydrolase superfamily protein [Actinidia rufa]
MGKARERRVATGSNRRRNRVEPSTLEDRNTESADLNPNHDRKRLTIFVISFIASSAIALIVYRVRYASHTNTSHLYVHESGLVKKDMNYLEILTENLKVSENTSHRDFANPVLAYITPCQGTKLILEGRHNADRGWISELRMKGNAKVLPRVVLEAFPNELLKKKKQRNKAIDLIVTECKEMEYDGIVLESWSRWAGYGVLHDPAMRNMALQFVKQLGQELHAVCLEGNSKQCLQLVYVIGPPYSEKLQEHDFGPEDLRSLSDAVDGFSLMTYDFSSPQHPGPNAPLKWIRSTLELLLGTTSNGAQSLAHKIFVGMNFYGNDFVLSEGLGGGAITGRDYLVLLEKHKPSLQWDENSAEHFFVYSDNQNIRHAVFYPTLMSISIRLEEARSWGAGLSIWEIGQGLDYFFDVM